MTSLELSNLPNTSLALPQPSPIHARPSSPPLSFSDFRFKTIGHEPQLLKRLTAPDSSHQYRSRSPTPAIATLRDLPKPPLSRPSLLQVLTQETSSQSNTDASNSSTAMATTSNVKSHTRGQAVAQTAQLNDMTNTSSHQSSKVKLCASSVAVEEVPPLAASPMNIELQTAGLKSRVNESTTSVSTPVPSGAIIPMDIDQARPSPAPSELIPSGGSGDLIMLSPQRQDIYSLSICQELSYPPFRPSPFPPLVERAPPVMQTENADRLTNDTSTHTTQLNIPPALSPLLALQSRVNLALSQHSELLATLTPLAVFLTQSAASAHATSLVASASAQKAAATVQHAIAQVEFCRVQADAAKFEAEQAAGRAQIAVNAAEAVRLKLETVGLTERDIGEVITEVKGVMEWATRFARGWEEEKRKEEAEAGRKAAEEKARKSAEEEARRQAEEAHIAEQKRKADEEARLRAEERKRLAEEEKRKATVEEERCQQEERERRLQEQIALDAENRAREAAERKRCEEADLEKQRQEEVRRQEEYERRQAEVVANRRRAIDENAAQIVAQRGQENAKEGQRTFESDAPGPSPSIAPQLAGDLPPDCPQLVEPLTAVKSVSGTSVMLSFPGGDSQVEPFQIFTSSVSPSVPSRHVLPLTSVQATLGAGESKFLHNPFVPAVTEAGKRVATDTPLSSTTLASEKRQKQRQTGTIVGAISRIAPFELTASTASLSTNNLKPDSSDVSSPLAILSSDMKDRHVSIKSTKVSPAQQSLDIKLPQAHELSHVGPVKRAVAVKAEPSLSPNLNTNRPLPPLLPPRPSPEVLLGAPASAGIPMPRLDTTLTRNLNSTTADSNCVDDQTMRNFFPISNLSVTSFPAKSQISSIDSTRPPSPLAISPTSAFVSLAPPNSSIPPPTGFASSDSRGRRGSYNSQPQRRRQPSGMDHYSPVRSTLRTSRDRLSPPRQPPLRRTNDYRRSSSPPSNFILPRREYDHYSPAPEAPYLGQPYPVGSQSPPNLPPNRKRRREEGTIDEGGPARRVMRNDRSSSPISGYRDYSSPNRSFEMLPDRNSWSPPPRMPASMRIGDSGGYSIIYKATPGEHNRRPASSRPLRENNYRQDYDNHDSYRTSGVQSPPLGDYNETTASAIPALDFTQARPAPSSSTSDRTPLLARMSDNTGPPIAPRAPANTSHTWRTTERGVHQPRGQGRARGTTRAAPRGTLASRLSSSTTRPVPLQDRLTD